jgi:UDP-N-acetylglucosamine pyrophosphorylase
VDVYVNEADNTIVIKRLPDNEQNYPEGVGCMGDTLTEEELQTLNEKGIMGLTAPWD